jgi:hypothetical protein
MLPPVFPILLIHSPPSPNHRARLCSCASPFNLIASARAVSSHLDFAPSSSFERPGASNGALVAISRPFPTSQTGKRIVVLAGPLLDPSLHIAIDKESGADRASSRSLPVFISSTLAASSQLQCCSHRHEQITNCTEMQSHVAPMGYLLYGEAFCIEP